jgi:hypothetical protein
MFVFFNINGHIMSRWLALVTRLSIDEYILISLFVWLLDHHISVRLATKHYTDSVPAISLWV